MKKIRICFASVILAVCTSVSAVNASALTLVFQGVAADMAGKDVTVGVYDKDPLADDFTLENVKYIDQSEIAEDGSFRMRIPLREVLDSSEGLTVRSNIKGMTVSEQQYIYCSDNGVSLSAGTKENPCSFKTALDIAASGDTIVLLDTITIPADFVWRQSDKTIRIEGYQDVGKLDLTAVEAFSVGCNVTFDNLELLVHDGTDSSSANQTLIYAQGNHVIMEKGVTTNHFVKAIFGGAKGKALTHTNLEVYGGDYKGIYGGGDQGNITGNSSVIVGGKTNSNTILTIGNSKGKFEGLKGTGGTVLAGGNGSNVMGTAFVTVKDDAVVQYVRGGGTGETNLTVGKCRINIEGGTIMNVFAAVGRSSRESEYICNSEVVMTGGEAEAVFAGAERRDIYGKITCYLLGGTITRRAYAGCYNDYGFSGWGGTCAVHGTATLVFGPDLGSNTMTDTQSGNGIFGGSRRSVNSSDEIGRLVFLDGCYDRFKANIGKNDMCRSHHDYLLSEGINGSAMFSDLTDEASPEVSASQIKITPDSGYDALLNGEIITDQYCALQNSALAEVSFISNGSGERETEITSAYGIAGSDGVNVNYYTAQKGKLIVVVYDAEDRLVGTAMEDVNPASSMQEAALSVDCSLNSTYNVKVMLWDGMDSIIPLCPPFPVSVNVQ